MRRWRGRVVAFPCLLMIIKGVLFLVWFVMGVLRAGKMNLNVEFRRVADVFDIHVFFT